MEEKKEKQESLTKQLYKFAGSYKYLSILSTILAAISAFVALVPFYYIWKVMQALKDAQCMDIIDKFKDGVHTMIGAKGIHVSGGEAQRLSIARAFLKNAPVLILDEATAFADPDNEQKVQKAFENLSKDKTVIMIAHRLSTVTNADRIYVLKDGAIAEEGSHGELLKSHGIYAHMWEEYNKSVNWKVGGAL